MSIRPHFAFPLTVPGVSCCGTWLTLPQQPHLLIPKVFGELKERYQDRPGGYTRVLRTETQNKLDQRESAILEFVDGPRDVRFMMTAMAVARDRKLGRESNGLTNMNVKKVTRYRKDGEATFQDKVEALAAKMNSMGLAAEQETAEGVEETGDVGVDRSKEFAAKERGQ